MPAPRGLAILAVRTPGHSIRFAGASLLAYVVAGKVLSPQYLVWLSPFVAVSGSGRVRWVYLVCCLLTTAVFPWKFEALLEFRRSAEALLLARNLALLWLFALLIKLEHEGTPARP